VGQQPLVEGLHDAGQQQAIAAVDEIGLHVADNAMSLIHGQTAQIVERACLPLTDSLPGSRACDRSRHNGPLSLRR